MENKRLLVLDTETTGLEVNQAHRIIEIGAVLVNNRVKSDQHFHSYLNPQRSIDEKAFEVHGISLESLEDKPLFEEIAEDFIQFVEGLTNSQFEKIQGFFENIPVLEHKFTVKNPNTGVDSEFTINGLTNFFG